jgi:hypothetical protein
MSTRTRNLIIVVAVLLLAAFLAGYFPQYQRASALETQLQQARDRVQSLERSAKLMRARDLAHLLHLETAKRNYGLAVQHAESFFSHIQSLQAEVDDPALKNGLAELFKEREAVIADLSQVAPAAEERVRQVVERVHGLIQGT